MSVHQVALVLTAIADRNGGRLTPELVVEAARDPASPLHSHFEWDDPKAAAAHRLDQARTLIRSVKIQVTVADFTLKAPRFVHDPGAERQQGYITVAKLRTDEDLARESVVAEFARAAAAMNRARVVAAVLGLSGEIDRLRGSIVGLTARLQPSAEEELPPGPAQ